MVIQIFTDGSRHNGTKKAGWGFLIVDDDAILYADCGECEGNNMVGEFQAVIHALLALPTSTKLELVTDIRLHDIATLDRYAPEWPHEKTGQGRYHWQLCRVIRRLLELHDVTLKQVKSGSHQYNRYADTLARLGCGLEPKPALECRRAAKRVAKRRAGKITNETCEFLTWVTGESTPDEDRKQIRQSIKRVLHEEVKKKYHHLPSTESKEVEQNASKKRAVKLVEETCEFLKWVTGERVPSNKMKRLKILARRAVRVGAYRYTSKDVKQAKIETDQFIEWIMGM